MSKIDENIAELQKLAAFGQAVLDAVKESGLIKQKRRARRQTTVQPRERKPRASAKAVPPANSPARRVPRGEIEPLKGGNQVPLEE